MQGAHGRLPGVGLRGVVCWGTAALRLVAAVCLVACVTCVLSGSARAQGTAPDANGTAAKIPEFLSPYPALQSAGAASAAGPAAAAVAADEPVPQASATDTASVWQWAGRLVTRISFEGVTFEGEDTLPQELPQQAGQPLDPEKVRQSVRRLFATGRYRSIEVRGVQEGNGVALVYVGPPRYYVGEVEVLGTKTDLLASLLERASKLDPGAVFYQNKLDTGTQLVKQTLEENGYYKSTVTATTQPDTENLQMNVTFHVQQGPRARVGDVTLKGDAGLTLQQFRKKSKLKQNSKVTRDTVTRALAKLRTVYQKKDHLEVSLTLEKQQFNAPVNHVDYVFNDNQGPVVKVDTVGAKVSKGKLKKLVPVYEEGAVDTDLLTEGAKNLRDSLQKDGYFDATVTVQLEHPDPNHDTVVYTIDRGPKHRVDEVNITGNKYFDTETLRERLNVQKADWFARNGRFSQSLLNSDVDSISSLYRANGFNQVTVTTKVDDDDDTPSGKLAKLAHLKVDYVIREGPQQRFGTVTLAGVDAARMAEITPLLNTSQGQPYSLATLSGDRDAILGYYLSHGFQHVNADLLQRNQTSAGLLTDVTFRVTEGEQVFVDKLLISGDHYTKTAEVARQLRLHPGDPLDQSALLDTQRNLYNLALFNEVNTAIQNPTGDVERKNVLLQLTEAKRWNVVYGFGFQAQTGTPQTNCIVTPGTKGNTTCNPTGNVGVSPAVSLDISRINLFGRNQTLTLRTAYGTLEKKATLIFENPRLFDSPHFGFNVSAGYTNAQDLTTFSSSRAEASVRVTETWARINTLIYDFTYRRVKVDQSTLQVSANLIPLLSEPVRVGGPEMTYIRDKRTPSPLDATKGSYLSVQEFFAHSTFGSQTDFNRMDATSSTYYTFGTRRKYTVARNTRFGFERSFGDTTSQTPNPVCQTSAGKDNPDCDAVPLPERLYAGGATSLRSFPIDAAGPRDLTTGYPVGGKAVFVNQTEVRLPPPTLPYVGSTVSFVLFHDMGNVFNHVADVWPSALRVHQPNSGTCRNVAPPITQGTCNFNDFTHAVGTGLRYKTPVGPLRVDFSYTLNPPIFPVIVDYNSTPANLIPPHVGQAGHFNFFFSIGQSF